MRWCPTSDDSAISKPRRAPTTAARHAAAAPRLSAERAPCGTGSSRLPTTGWRVIAPQLRGFDGGAGDPPAASVDDYAGDVIDLLDALHLKQVVVGGLSMGGYVAFALLRLAARYVQGLVLADTRSQADTPEGVAGRTRAAAGRSGQGAVGRRRRDDPEAARRDDAQRTRPAVAEQVRSLALASSADAIAGAIRALDDAARFDAAALVDSRADADRRRRRGHADAAGRVGRDAARDRRLRAGAHLSQAGHLSNLEQPESVQRRARGVPRPIGYSRGTMRVQCDRAHGFTHGWRARSSVGCRGGDAAGAGSARRREPGRSISCSISTSATATSTTARIRSERGEARRLSSASWPTASIDKLSRDEQLAFWLNAYDAARAQDRDRSLSDSEARPQATRPRASGRFPARSSACRIASPGARVTLDQIEQTILPTFHDPRVYFALGRGAVGSGRLRSEAFTAARLEEQLADVAVRVRHAARSASRIDRETGKVSASSIFSWRSKEFADAYADKAPAAFASRSPIERAVIAFVMPKLLGDREGIHRAEHASRSPTRRSTGR